MSTKRRIQNRLRTFGQRASWPADHNEAVRIRRTHRRLIIRIRPQVRSFVRAMREMGRAAVRNSEEVDRFADSVRARERHHDPRTRS